MDAIRKIEIVQPTDVEEEKVWDMKAQQFHGGQDWKFCNNFVEDFSVTTNGLGTPKLALDAAMDAIQTIAHYPPADFEPAISDLAEFLWPAEFAEAKPRLMMGNGASELIDLVVRWSNKVVGEGKWRPGSTLTQYKEYERSAIAAGFTTTNSNDDDAKLLCLVNPTNPTGDYYHIEELKSHIEEICPNNSTVLVDESMQMWLGPEWRNDSLLTQSDWIKEMSEERGIHVFLMHSWTKIWSCTGVRIGSVVCPTAAIQQSIKSKQVPWSVNSMALAFTSAAVKDQEYLSNTWSVTKTWRSYTVNAIHNKFSTWKTFGEDFLSWVWVDCGSEETAEKAVALCKAAGVPIRSGKPGYELPTYIRLAVRKPALANILLEALSSLEH